MKPGSPLTTITRISATCTTNPLTLSMSPNERAVAAGMPNFWKNRTSSASRAAVAGRTSEMNWIAYCSIRTGMYRSRAIDAPRVAPASAAWIERRQSSASHEPGAVGRAERWRRRWRGRCRRAAR